MDRFLDYLAEEVRGFEVVRLIARLLLIDFAWTFLVMMALVAMGQTLKFYDYTLLPLPGKITLDFAIFIFAAAMVEEGIFRFIPLLAVVWLRGKSPAVISVMIISSIIFGVSHGGLINILSQGVGGFFLSIAFLKCGGFQFRPLKALLCSTTMHFIWNMVVFGVAIWARGTLG